MSQPTTMMMKMGGMGQAAQREQFVQAPSPFADPGKEKGERTAKQVRWVENFDHATDMVRRTSLQARGEMFPAPPDSPEMVQLALENTRVANAIYQAHPVKQVPYASTVLQAYRHLQSNDLWGRQASLMQLYA